MWRVPLSRRQLDDAGLTALFLLCGVGLYLAGLNRIGGLSVVGVPTWFSLVTPSVAAAFQLTRSTRPALTLTLVASAGRDLLPRRHVTDVTSVTTCVTAEV